ncbi:MAG TPA: YXWGXW repeat-containing protein [Ramlibacter sp.]
MNRKTLIAAALAAGSLMGVASVAHAVPAVVAGTGAAPVYPYPGGTVYPYGHQVVVQPAPPAPLYEPIPAQRAGYIWAPGHYVWNGSQYVWQRGHWLEMRQGYAWQAPHWQQRADGSWYLAGGTWVRTDNLAYERRMNRGANGDMDHDGIRNADDDDRDGDGVANWRDDFPNNRNRS